jgi:prevent-host-death family protein
MTTVGLRELRQQATDLVRRVEAGEEITITVAGREAARLVRASARQWRSWATIQDLFPGEADAGWDRDRDRIDQAAGDPWAQR